MGDEEQRYQQTIEIEWSWNDGKPIFRLIQGGRSLDPSHVRLKLIYSTARDGSSASVDAFEYDMSVPLSGAQRPVIFRFKESRAWRDSSGD